MADESKTTTPKTPPRPESMPIAMLLLSPAIEPYVTGFGRAKQGNKIAASPKCTITFVPHLRHHRVEVTDAKGAKTWLIHESNVVQWEAVA